MADDIAQAISEPVVNNDQKNVSEAPPAGPQIMIVASGNELGMRLQPIFDKVVELGVLYLPKVWYVATTSLD